MDNRNPLLEAYVTPPLDRIRPEHFLPALDTLMDKVAADFAALRDNPAPPTFANTAVPLEGLLNPISDLRGILSLYVENASTDQLEEIEQTINKKVSAFEKTLLQDPVLIRRFDAVWKNRAALLLDEDDKAILRDLHRSFEASGAFLSAPGQERIRQLDARLIDLAKKFNENLKKDVARQAILVTDEVELAGINDGDRESFAEAARKQGHAAAWLISPERSLVDSLLAQAENSSFRKKIFEALNRLGTTGGCDNHPVIDEMQAVRREYAQLLGYPTYAAAARSRYMMKDVGKVEAFLAEMADAAILAKWDDVIEDIADFAARNGGPANIEPWDTPYWAEKRRADLLHFDANAFSEYLALDNVLDGMFSEAGHLFGLTFEEIQGQAVIHPDVKVFEVRDKATGEQIGLLHADFYARPDTGDGAPVKRGGAWMSQLQSKASGRPNIVGFNTNIVKPTGGTALLSLGQYTTAYHELGHALQGLRGTKVKYRSLQGTAGPSDFTEFHSMVNERRATLKENLKAHALHYQTGRPPTDQMVNALIKSQSYYTELRGMLLLVQNSQRDLAFHIAAPGAYASAEALQDAVRLKTPYADNVRPYPLTRFTHLFDSSHSYYAAGYCNYLIANVHAADGFEPFETDPYDLTWSKRLSDLYNRGSGGEPLELYRAYRGRDANPAALLRVVGEGVLKSG